MVTISGWDELEVKLCAERYIALNPKAKVLDLNSAQREEAIRCGDGNRPSSYWGESLHANISRASQEDNVVLVLNARFQSEFTILSAWGAYSVYVGGLPDERLRGVEEFKQLWWAHETADYHELGFQFNSKNLLLL